VEFEYRYFGATAVDSGAGSSSMSFAPDVRREPTYFRGELAKKLPFREAISALHDVVVSDLTYIPKDRSLYMDWRRQQDELDWDTIAVQREETAKQLAAMRKELDELQRRRSLRMSGFYAARQKYFDFLLNHDKNAWWVLDPVITVHPDEVFFECFSIDESSYGRLGCNYDVFAKLGEFACGTTNVDYSARLYGEFQKIRDYKSTVLEVDASGFEVQTTAEDSYREVKIDLPDTWVRGFLQVSSAMTLPGVTFDLHPMDVHNFCFLLRRQKEKRGPRSMRYILKPGQPVRVVFEPWNITLDCPRSIFTGEGEHEIRIWGRRRLHILERLIPVAKRFTVTLLGSGMPSFFVADMGSMNFTLGLSGWTANDWSRHGNFDLMAPRAEVDTGTQQAVFEVLKRRWYGTADAIAAELSLDRATVLGALSL